MLNFIVNSIDKQMKRKFMSPTQQQVWEKEKGEERNIFTFDQKN